MEAAYDLKNDGQLPPVLCGITTQNITFRGLNDYMFGHHVM
jgi:hypothetical protein